MSNSKDHTRYSGSPETRSATGNFRDPRPWQSAYARFAKWRDDVALETEFHALSENEDMEISSMESTVKVYKSDMVGKTADKAIGCTVGGLNTKIYAVVENMWPPANPLLYAGNDHDSVHAIKSPDLLERTM